MAYLNQKAQGYTLLSDLLDALEGRREKASILCAFTGYSLFTSNLPQLASEGVSL